MAVPSDPPRIAQSERGKKLLVGLLIRASDEQNPTSEKLKKETKNGDMHVLRACCFAPDVGNRTGFGEEVTMAEIISVCFRYKVFTD